MKKTILILIVVLALAAAAYHLYPKPTAPITETPPATPTAPDNSVQYKDAVITLERTPCFGFCPAYKLTIYGDGRVVYDGKTFVKVKGTQTSSITEAQVKDLVDEFYRINYFSLQDRYEAQVTDLPTNTTSLTIGSKTKQVVNYFGAPPELSKLEEKIDIVANTKAWTGECTSPECN